MFCDLHIMLRCRKSVFHVQIFRRALGGKANFGDNPVSTL